MSNDVQRLRGHRVTDESVTWSRRDAALYAVACGMGRDRRLQGELSFVTLEPGMAVMPSFASLLAGRALLANTVLERMTPRTATEKVTFFVPLADAGSLRLDSRIAAVEEADGGGALQVALDCDARNALGDLCFSVQRTVVPPGPAGGPALQVDLEPGRPARNPDLSFTQVLQAEQALLFRIAAEGFMAAGGPVVDPAGTLAPCCTWGAACRAILATICEFDVTLLRSLSARFPALARTGDTLLTEMWQQANIVFFQVRAVERDELVLSHGRCELAA
jgi:acyl dehydratase